MASTPTEVPTKQVEKLTTMLIFGGSGKVSRHLTTQLVKKGHQVHSIIRKPEQVDELRSLGANPIVQSIEDSSVADLAETIRKVKPEAVIWSAGAGGGNPERTRNVDNLGAIKCFDAMASAGETKRLILVSALDVRDKENDQIKEPEWYDDNDRERSDRIWKAINPYFKAKLASDKELVTGNDRRGLKYTILRPGSLTQDPGVGTVSAGRVHLGNPISREDVATAIIACLENEKTAGLAFDVLGGDVPIADAIAKVAEQRIDCFTGYF